MYIIIEFILFQVPLGYSPVVRSLENAGHEIVAIANMHELAFGITSENYMHVRPALGSRIVSHEFGNIDNPHMLGYIPGGSSGGSAAAVATNSVTFSLGTDTGGSMRIPASLCGVVGYRPSTGLYDTLAVCPLSSTTDTIGIFAQQVPTVQEAHKCIVEDKAPYTPTQRPLNGVRIGVPRKFYYSILDPEVSRVTEAALDRLTKAGAVLVSADFSPDVFNEGITDKSLGIVSYETNALIPEFLKANHPSVTYDTLCSQVSNHVVKTILENAKAIPKDVYEKCLQSKDEVCKEFDRYFASNNLDAFVCPTTILPAIKRPTPAEVEVKDTKFPTLLHAYIHNSIPQALGGVPCVSLPSGRTSEDLPVGLELVAPRGQDNKLLDLAASVQHVLPALPQLSFEDFRDKLIATPIEIMR